MRLRQVMYKDHNQILYPTACDAGPFELCGAVPGIGCVCIVGLFAIGVGLTTRPFGLTTTGSFGFSTPACGFVTNGQNPNNLENTNNENGMNANVLGNAQSLGNIPNVPNPIKLHH